MKMASKMIALLLALVLALGLISCSGNNTSNTSNTTASGDTTVADGSTQAGDTTAASETTQAGQTTTTVAAGTTNTVASTQKVGASLVKAPDFKMPDYKFLSKVKGFHLKIVDPWVGASPGTQGWIAANNVKKAVESRYGCTFTQTGVTSGYPDQVIARQTANNPLGHVLKVQDFFFLPWLERGYYSNLNYGMDESFVDISDTETNPWYHAASTNFFNIDNNLVAFRHGNLNDAPMIWYDKDKVKRFGTDPLVLYQQGKWTMDKLKEYARKAKSGNQIGFLASDYTIAGVAFAHTTGGSLLSVKSGATPVPNVSDSKTIAGLQVMYEWFQTDKIMSIPSGSWDQPYKDFWSGKASMILTTNYASTKHGGTFKGTMGFVPFPKGNNSQNNLHVNSQFSTWIPSQYQKDVPVIMFIHNAKDRESWAYTQTDSVSTISRMGFEKNSTEYKMYEDILYGRNGQTSIFNPIDLSDANGSDRTWGDLLSLIGTSRTVQSTLDAYGSALVAAYKKNWGNHKLTGKY